MTTHEVQPEMVEPPLETQPPMEQTQPPLEQTQQPVEQTQPPLETQAPLEAQPPGETQPAAVETDETLFGDGELSGLRSRWTDVQSAFVDDPRDCVQKADGLVSDVVEKLTSGFSQARSRLEEQWDRGEDVSTEDLRIALKRYREFFERLLAV